MADSSQLDIETQINAALRQRQALMDQNKSSLVDQVAIAQELCRALDCDELDGFNERIQQTRQGLLDAADAGKKTTKTTQNLSAAAKKSSKSFFSFKGAALGAAVAMKNAFGAVGGVLKSLGTLALSLVKGAFSLVRGAFQAWNSMLAGMAQKAQEGANASLGYLNAIEGLKETLGDLSTGAGKAAMDSFKKLKAGGKSLAGTGISLSKVFGRGPDGYAAALEYVGENMAGLGPQMDRFASQMADAADEVILLGKGLGFAGEDFGRMATMAGYAGETLKETMQRIAKEITTVSKKFKVNSRVMAANFKVMFKMPAVFGSNTKEMLKTSVAAQKLGMSIEELTAATAVFDDFESGAKAAADLAAEFSVVVSSMDMMTATPAEQMMLLKEAVEASGQSFEDMSRQERMRMAELMGMDATGLQKMMDPSQAFDKKEMDKVDKGIENATKATLKMTEAVKELAKSFKQVHEAGESMNVKGGFLTTFLDGMARGFMRSKEMKSVLKNVYSAFRKVFNAGKRVGDKLGELIGKDGPFYFFAKYFEDLNTSIDTILPKVEGAFDKFVDALKGDTEEATHALSNLITDLKEALFPGDGGGITGALFEGMAGAIDLIAANLINLAPTIACGLLKMFQGAIALMSGDYSMFSTEMGEKFAMPLSMGAIDSIKNDEVFTKLGDTFMEMMQLFWDKYGEKIKDFLGMVISAVFVAALIKATPMILAAGALKGLAMGIFQKFGSQMGDTPAGGGAGAPPEPDMATKIDDFFLGIESAVNTLASIWDSGNLMKAVGTIVVIAGTFGLALLGLIMLGKKMEDEGVSAVTMAVLAASVYGIAKAGEAVGNLIKVLEKVKVTKGVAGKAAAALAAVMIVYAAVATISYFLIKSMSKLKTKPGLSKTVEAAGSLTMSVAKATALLLGMAAVITVISVISKNPIIATLLAIAIGGAIIIFMAVAALVKSMVNDFSAFSEEKGRRAAQAACAAGKITDVVVRMLDELQKLVMGTALRPVLFYKALEQMKCLVGTIADTLLPTVMEVARGMTIDPSEVKEKMDVLVTTMQGFAPIAEMMAAALMIKDMDPDKVGDTIRLVTGGISKIFTNMGGLVRNVMLLATGITDKRQIEAMKAIGPMMSGVASVMSAIKAPSEMLVESMRDVYDTTAAYEQSGPLDNALPFTGERVEKVYVGQKTDIVGKEGAGDALIKQQAYISHFADVLDGVSGPLTRLIGKISRIKIKGSPSTVGRNMKMIGDVMGALGGTMDVVEKIKKVSKDEHIGIPEMFTIRQSLGAIALLFVKGNLPGTGDSVPLQDSVADVTEGIYEFVKRVGKKKVDGVATFAHTLLTISGMFSTLGKLSETDAAAFGPRMAAIVDSFGGLKGKFTKSAMEPLTEMILAFNELGIQLESKDNWINIDTLLQNVTDALEVSDTEHTVRRGSVNVTVNLTVRLTAANVGEVLVKGAYVAPGTKWDSDLQMMKK